jgi:hypothetical protein
LFEDVKHDILSGLSLCISDDTESSQDDSIKDKLLSYALRLANDEIVIEQFILKSYNCESFIVSFEREIFIYGGIKCKFLDPFDEEEIANYESRLIEVWHILGPKVQEYLKGFIPTLTCLSTCYTHDELVQYASQQWDRKNVMPVYRQILKLECHTLTTATLRFLAHMFFVNDFASEIVTDGYLGMINLSFQGKPASRCRAAVSE